MGKIPTVMIDVNGSPVLINESDFDKDKHELWEEGKEAPPVESKPTPSKPEVIHKGGGKWIVEVDGKRINEDYLTKAEAQALAAEQ